MKKRFAALFLILTTLLLLSGCSSQQDVQPQEPVREPDTDTRTLTRSIGESQTVVYRFHTEKPASWDDMEINLAFFDKEAESFDQADNWCTVRVGDARAKHPFFADHAQGIPEEECWDSSNGFRANWTMLAPYDSIEDVESADMALIFTRSGKMVKAMLEVDGAKAWEGRQTIAGLTDETLYLYVYVKNRALSDIEFQDMGKDWLMPTWLRWLLFAASLVAAYILHRLARKGEDKVFLIEGGAMLLTTGFFVFAAALALMLWGRGHPDILSTISFGYIPFQIPADGMGFWIPAVVAGVGTVGFVVLLFCMALGDLENPVVYLLGSLLFGFCHTLWLSLIAFVILQSLGQIMELILAILFIALLILVAAGMDKSKGKYQEVQTTTRIYNDIGNLVDVKYHTDYIEVPEKKNKNE